MSESVERCEIHTLREERFHRLGGREELGGELVGLAFGGDVAGGLALVHDEMAEFVCASEAVSVDVSGPSGGRHHDGPFGDDGGERVDAFDAGGLVGEKHHDSAGFHGGDEMFDGPSVLLPVLSDGLGGYPRGRAGQVSWQGHCRQLNVSFEGADEFPDLFGRG